MRRRRTSDPGGWKRKTKEKTRRVYVCNQGRRKGSDLQRVRERDGLGSDDGGNKVLSDGVLIVSVSVPGTRGSRGGIRVRDRVND